MDVNVIEKLEGVLNNLGPNKILLDYKLSRLTAPGENYGSLMLRLDIKTKSKTTNEEETWNLIAKLLAPNELLRELFNVQVTYKNEACLYSVIVPTLKKFEQDQGVEKPIDYFAKYYGHRLNLHSTTEEVDDDAVLILENLKVQGFSNINRLVGYDFECAKFLVKNLAYFHAVPLALKLNNPEVFEQNIKPYLSDFFFGDEGFDDIVKVIIKILNENEACIPYLKTAEHLIRQKSVKIAREPFVSIIHNDYWINNMMLKFKDEKPVAHKMLDFQVIEYKCPCRDLLFFLFSSVQLKVLQENFEYLLSLYYTSLTAKLKELKSECSYITREVFDKELELAMVESEFFHISFMLFPINTDSSNIKELSDLSVDDFKEESNNINKQTKEKLWYLVLECARKGWLK